MEQHKYTTGGGLSKKDTPKHVKRGKKRLAIVAALVTAAAAVGVVFGANSLVTARAAGNTVVDPDTTNVWNQIAASSTSTQNIGRIWTDKSVFDADYEFDSNSPLTGQDVEIGESDFLVSLSALSSTSNLKTTTTSTKPLDIVLVLDQSGSMGDSFGGWGSGSRRAALQEAAENFVNATEQSNQGLEQNKQHRISIVTFDTGSRVSRGWTYVSGNGANQLRSTIDGLSANGATRVDLGMNNASSQLNSARQDATKVVIVFTDGDPTSGSSFENEVAADAINTAYTIKQSKGAKVYTIGIFSGANPNTDNKANNYMNAMSSNYPAATADGENGGWFDDGYFNITWGDGSRNDGYYKSATNSEELNKVFEEISEDITTNAGSGSPIEEVIQEGAVNPGTLTFTDTLGSYMTVSGGTMTVVYGDKKFDSTNKTTSGSVDTYHFEGTVTGNDVYKEADLADLTVTVTHDPNLAKGDVVTAQIPASLIPMRNYNVDTNEKTMTVTDAYPIRLFFGVSLKDNAKKAIEQGSGDVYDAIVESNKTDDGNATFYSNLFTNGSGDTTASFTPSDGNKFYYYTSDTALYLDAKCSQRATRDNINGYDTLYYSEPYWEITSGTSAHEVTRGIAIENTGQDWGKIAYDRQDNAYIPAGTQRLDRPATLNSNKTKNETGTALTVLTPEWDGTAVSQHLGNNGKIAFPLPGELEIKKTVDWGNASDETKQGQNSFTFTVNFNGDETLSGSFVYDVYETGEQPVRSDTVIDGGTITLKDGQRAVIKGLPTGTTFTVTEAEANMNGFTTTDTATADPNNDTTDGIASGTIVGGSQQSVSFQNNYKADEPVKLSTKTGLKAKKTLTGRDWRASDEFSFQITQIDNGAPTVQMDDPTKIDITQQTNQQTASFGDITFSESGQYRFRVEELSDTDQGITPIAGIDYSGAIYRVMVDVADAGQGALEVTSVLIEQMTNDDGGQGSGEVQGDTMTFTNKYVVDQASETLQGTKIYTDTTGGNPIDAGKFSFQLEALGGYDTGTVEGDTQTEDYTIAADSDAMPKPAGMTGTTLETGNVGDTFQFPTIYFDGNDVGKTFEYRITELPHKYQDNAEPGMTYDTNTSYVVKIVVTEEEDPDSEDQKAVIKAEPSLQPSDITFTNTYEPASAKLEGSTAIHGTKTLVGRPMKEGESFYFQLSASNDNAKTVLTSPKTVTVSSQDAMDFSFGEMTFTKVGEYVFTVNEVADTNGAETADGSGMEFDQSIYTVTVNVTDEKDGSLKADVTYKKDDGTPANEAAFTNVYTATHNYGDGAQGGIFVTKMMSGRQLLDGEFSFTIKGMNPESEALLAGSDRSFTNRAQTVDAYYRMSKLTGITFDQDDAGKTFKFIVDEIEPEADKLAGVRYDQSQFEVDIKVVDNGDGTMHTVTTVTQTKAQNGDEANKIIVSPEKGDSSKDDYKAPAFGFLNHYEPTPAVVSDDLENALQVTKKVEGAPSPDGVSYTFTLTATNENGHQNDIEGLDENNQITVTTSGVIEEGKTQTLNFGELKFTEPGTYDFEVSEVEPTADDGWTYDTDKKTITVSVTAVNPEWTANPDGGAQKYDGHLYIDSVMGNNPTFTNRYQADPVVVGGEDAEDKITVKKSVTGADSTSEFKFKIEPVIDEDHTEKWWRERVSGAEGFNPEVSISGVTQSQAGTVNFGGIVFKAKGVYEFTIAELGAADFNAGENRNGWTYDEHTATVTVTVTDTDYDGKLEAEVSYDNTSATTEADKAETTVAAFTNKYTTTPAVLEGNTALGVQKVVSGADTNVDFTFSATFNASAEDNTGSADNIEGLVDGKLTAAITDAFVDGVTKSADFGTVKFTAPGTYVFDVIEDNKADENSHWTYDGSTHQIKVTVTDNGQGALVASVDGNDPLFRNTYYNEGEAKDVTSKNGNGSFAGVGDELTYTIDWVNNAVNESGAPVAAQITITDVVPAGTEFVSADNNGSNENGTVTWNLGEKQPGDKGTVSFTVKVTEAAVSAGSVENTATVNIGENNPKQTNTVTTDTPMKTATLPETDTNGIQVGDELTFTIDYLNSSNENGTVTVTDVLPDSLTYVGVPEGAAGPQQEGQTLTWTIEDVEAGEGGTITFTAKVNEKATTVSVDNKATVTVGKNNYTSNITTNGQVPTGELNVSKTVEAIGATVDTQKDFTFTITLTGTDDAPLTGTYTYTVADGAEQDLSFADGSATITLKHGQTAKIAGLPQGATYSVVESPAGTGYSTVSENANGTVSDTAATATFTNTYKPGETPYNPSGTANVAVTKNVTGNGTAEQLTKAGYSFQFSVKNVSDGAQPTDGFTMPEDATGTSNADGTVNFNDISFNAVGTYEITVWEIAPEDDDTEKPGVQSNNVTYDQHKLVYTLNVTDDDHNGTLDFAVAEDSVSTNENVFTNVFFDEETAKSVTSENAAGDKGDGSMASVGDKLTYTINWVNNAVDENGTPQAATVVVKDTIPEHTTLDESTLNGGEYDAETRTITWTFENQPVGATGTITFTVTVDESAAGTDVQNNATVTVGENDYTTNTVTTTIPGKDVAPAEGDENGVQVGDILTYTIDYANTTDAAATVTVVDTLPDGLTYVDETGDTPTPVIEGQKLTWTIADVPAGTKGELTFTARVNENALTVENPLDNTATIKVGNNTYTTDTTTGEKPETGNLTVSKTVVANGGATIDANKSFSFKIELKDAGGNILTGSYKANVYQGEKQVGTADFIVSGADNAETTERDETTFTLKHGEHIVISGLPEGATYTVTEAAPGAGYVATSENASGTIATEGASAAFTNTYTPGGVTLGDDSAIQVIKKVTGASATEDFTFSIALDENNEGPEDGVTLPENKTATVTKDSLQLAENANEASASAAFGAISFTKAGTYTFVIDETNADPANDSGWTYDQGVCTVTVRVDNDYATGSLKIGDVQYYDHGTAADAATFTNSYKAGSITTGEDDLAKLQVTKVVTGAPAAEEFSFELRPAEDYGTKVTGLNNGALTVSTNQMTGQSDPQTLTFGDLTFNEEGTYVFNVTETTDDAAEGSGWTYDNDAAEQITVVVTDPDKDGKLNATTVVDEKDTNNPTFTNVYVPAEVTVGDNEAGLQVTKNVTGAPATEEFQFTLQLTSDNAAYVKGLGANNSIVMSTTGLTGTQGTETVDFGDLTFTKTGDYIFTVTENTTTDAAGWTYDNAPKTITVHVTDEGFDGQLDATVEGNDNLTVTNRYESGSTTYDPTGEAGVAVTKVVTGNGTDEQMSPAGYDFTIGVKNVTDPESPTDEGFSLPNPATGTSDAEGAVAFGNITFSQAGDYEVTVSEVNGGKTNVTYDTHSLVYTLHVTDTDYDGYLEVAVDEGTVDEGEATFTNVYYDEKDAKDVFDAEDPTTEVDGKLVGVGDTLRYTIDWAATEAGTVTVTDVVPAGTTVVDDSVSQGGTLSEDGRTITWTFENQAFGACGTVSFDVTVDESAATVGKVQNSATITVGDNTYTTNTTKNPVPEKTETSNPDKIGAGTTLSYQISFTNTDGEGATATVVDSLTKGQNYVAGTAKVNGEALEPEVEGDATTGQTLTWNLSNLAADAEVTITFDVTVTRDAGAEVNNTATVNDHSTNTTTTPYPSDDKKDVFEAEDPTTSVNGKLVGVGDELTYTIDWAADVDGTVTITDTIPAGTELVNNTISDNGSYNEETNTITWSLGEKSMGDKGTVSFNVVVTDDAAENDPVTNTANITVGENDPKVVTATTDIPVKDYEDTTPETGVQVGDVLTYTIEWANDSGQTSDVVITDTLPLGLTYVGVVEGATEPEVSEVEGQQVLTWTLEDQADGAEGTVTFNAMVNEDAITAEDSLHNQATIIVGENDYKTNTTGDEPDDQPKTGSLTVTKTVVAEAGATIDTNKSFSFTLGLKAANGTTVLTNEYTAQAYNAEGTPVGPEFTVSDGGTFTLKHGESMVISGLPEGATYSVTEAATDGYTADAATMNGTIPTGEDNAFASFTNTYAVAPTTLSGAVNLNVVKNLEGRSWLDTDEFSFVLAADEANPAGATLPEQTELTIAGNTEGHTASFGDITFTQPGTFTFTVTEQPSAVAGVTNDANATRTIVVSVVDNHDGTMTATVDAENSDDLVFTNTFETTPVTLSGASAIKVQKTLAGRDWADGETFEFTLVAASEGAPMPESAKLTIDEPTTGSVNTAAFGDMTFTQPGTYVYTISETAGEDATISYDGHTAEVTVAVFQGGNGHDANELWAQVSYNNGTATNEADQAVTGAAAFTNTQGLESKVELTGTKEITGRDFIEGDAFTFTVTGEDDAPMPDGVDQDGNVTINPTEGSKATIDFGAITFTEAGEYVYHVAEAEGTIDGMTYDTARRDVIITVTDDGLGNLSAQITSGADQLAWTNAWAFQGATFAELNGTKTMSGKELKNGQFTFLVKPQDNAPMGDTLPANFNGGATQNEDGTWTAPVSLLSNIAFDEAGDYVYVISEVNDGQPGVTYDDTQYRVTLSVANDGTVSQKIEQSENGTDWTDATAVAFANSYATDDEATLEGAVNLTGTKTLQGRDWLDDDSFTFLLAQTDGNKDAVRMPAETAVVVQGNYSDGAAVPFAFGDIVFTEAGDYAFTISEQQPGSDGFVGNTDGITYDDHVVTISVNVADNGEGKLEATVTGVEGSNSWTNVYKAGGEDKPGILSGAENLVVTKVIEGREWLDTDAFTFTLAADESNPDGVTMPAETTLTINANSENHQAAFGDITFANPGNYKFTVTETAGDIEGMTYDTTAHVVEVSVVDNEDGTLTASVVSPIVAKDLTFTNTYEPTGEVVVEPTEGEFQLTKVLEGKKWDGDEFTFELTGKMGQAADGALIRPGSDAFPMPDETTITVSAANGTDASGNDQATFGFGPITYAAAGTYTYEVREVAGDNAGMTYDNHVATVTVTVTDNLHGGYVAAVSVSGGEFKNTYHTELDYNAEGKGGLWILKNLENHDIADGQFEFTVTAADDASAAKAGFDGMSKVVKSAAGTVDATAEGKQVATSAAEVFGSMQFTQDDADDTYTYTVAETKGGAEGYTNDETVYTVTITTADDGQGTLEVTTHVVGGFIDQTFVYDNDATTEDAQVVVPFNNSYQARGTFDGDGEGAVRINATKELVNAQMNGGEFTFNVTDAQGNVVSSATNAADGSIDFSAIEFTKEGMLNDAENLLASYEKVDGKDTFTYQYTVSEDTTALPAGVTANVTSFSIKVVVTDNNDGTLSFSVVYPEGTEGLAFKNTYGTTETGAASLNVAGTKTLKTAEPGLTAPDITGSYTFTLTGSEGAPMPEVTTATNDAAGNVTFGEIVYTIENVFADDLLAEDEPVEGEGDATVGEDDAVDTQALEPRSKTFTYTVEESGEVAGVTNDANATRTFTVVVTDNADGTLSVTDGEGNAIQGGLTFDFVNTYSVTPTDPTDPTDPDPTDPSGAAWLTITKALTGRELNEGEFTFALEGIRGTASEGMSLTATNDANGNVTFADGLTFTRPGAYGFTIHEVKGELGGVTYDGAVYTATAQVTDNSNGTLSVTWLGADVDQRPVDAVTFNNTYTVKPTSVVLGGTKVLDGRELSAGEFSFQLADKDGKVIDTAANGEDGTFAFTSVEFDEAGVYEYVISEIVPEDTDAKTAGVQKDNVTYDETSFSVKVTVTDDGQGNLSVSEVTYNGDVKLPVFTNVYVEPEPAPEPEQPAKPEEPAKPEKPAEPEKPSKTPLPQAGDGTSAAFATALLAGGAALVAKALALVKRRYD